MVIWGSERVSIDEKFHEFTVANDPIIDMKIIEYDVYGSIAHAYMLKEIGTISQEEFEKAKEGLVNILQLIEDDNFAINPENEDCHTELEKRLTDNYGEVGRKIHTFRSRNDQVLTAIRLYSKDNLIDFGLMLVKLGETLYKIAEENENVPMPGYTHFRMAMPSSVGMLFDNYLEILLISLNEIKNKLELVDICPLGSGTGYGSPAKINRQLTAELLGFSRVQENSLSCQNSRGLIEASIMHALLENQQNLTKIAYDLITFSEPHFGYFTIPERFTTGSSAMPQKKNADGFELMRGYKAHISGYHHMLSLLSSETPSGYNRDLQLTKEPFIKGMELAYLCTDVMNDMLAEIIVNEKRCVEDCVKNPELYATHEALDLAAEENMPYRDAYLNVKDNLDNLRKRDPVNELKRSTHIGGTGNLPLQQHKERLEEFKNIFAIYRQEFDKMAKGLLSL